MYQRRTSERTIKAAKSRRHRMFMIQNGLCDCCKLPIEITYCFEVKEKPSKHFNLFCPLCYQSLNNMSSQLKNLQRKYKNVLLYLKRKKMYHKAMLKLNNMRGYAADVLDNPPKPISAYKSEKHRLE
jgi:hypothetical protein